jgi:nucleotide-binding universal stress UspA family protein
MAYKRILVPVDGSPTSRLGLREAIGFARAQKARLQLVHAALRQSGRRTLANAAQLARQAGLACDTVLLETLTGPAAEPIVRQAKKWRMLIRSKGLR